MSNMQSTAGYVSMSGAVDTVHSTASGVGNHLSNAFLHAFSFPGFVKGISITTLNWIVPRLEGALIPMNSGLAGNVMSFAVQSFNNALTAGIMTA